MEWGLAEEDWKKVMRLFSMARDRYFALEQPKEARECDDAIALVQRIALDPKL